MQTTAAADYTGDRGRVRLYKSAMRVGLGVDSLCRKRSKIEM